VKFIVDAQLRLPWRGCFFEGDEDARLAELARPVDQFQ
jgi:hypothetical protein